jgi:outer membrane protein assembly factor BamB
MFVLVLLFLSWSMFGNTPEHTGFSDVRFDNLNLEKFWEFSLESHEWRYTRNTSVWSSQPVIAKIKEKTNIFIGSYDQNLYCVDGLTGKEKWRFPTSGKINNAPCFLNLNREFVIFFASSDRTFYAINAETGKKKWSYETLPWEYTVEEAVASSPVSIEIDNRKIVFIGFWNANRKSVKPVQSGEVLAFDAETGVVIWKKKISNSYVNSPVVTVVDQQLYLFVTTRDGKIFSLSGNKGEVIWNSSADGEIRSSPSIFMINGEKYLLIGTRFGSLYCLDVKSGSEKWYCRAGHIIDSTPAVCEINGQPRIFFGSYDRHVYAVDGLSGEKIWKFPTGKYISASPAIAKFNNDVVVFVNSLDDYIYALSGSEGNLLWKFKGGKRIWDYEKRGESLWSSPAVYSIDNKTCLLFPSYDGTLYAFCESP